MGTTVFFAEIFIIGLQATVWAAVFAAALFGTRLSDLAAFQGWEMAMTLVFLALAHTLGLLVDRLADALFSPLDHRMRPAIIPEKEAPVWRMRLYLISRDDGLTKFVEFSRTRIRIVRATVFNLLMLLAGVVALWLAGRSSLSAGGMLLFLAAGAAGIGLSFYAWRRMTKAYYKRMLQAYIVQTESPAQISGQS